RELRAVLAGRQTKDQALARYHAFSAGHARPFRWMLRMQRLIPRIAPRLLASGLKTIESKRFMDWAFGHYLNVAHPQFVGPGPAVYRPVPATRMVRALTPQFPQPSTARSTTL